MVCAHDGLSAEPWWDFESDAFDRARPPLLTKYRAGLLPRLAPSHPKACLGQLEVPPKFGTVYRLRSDHDGRRNDRLDGSSKAVW